VTYDDLEARLAAWSATQPDIRAVIVTGSRARGDADTWSDLDVLMFTREREKYAGDKGWFAGFGEVWASFTETSGSGDPIWFVLYEGSVKLDVTLMAVEDAALDLEAILEAHPYKNVFARGVKVLYDAKASPRMLPPKPVTPTAPPTAATFDAVVSEFLLEGATTAKFIARGDLWRAQRWMGDFMRRCLLRVIEWHAIGSGDERDTWYGGRFMEQWADARFLAARLDIFAQFERGSMIRALRAMLDLMRLLGTETAARFELRYPAETHDKIAASIETTLKETP
jgi:aminoglycoside 6-adenylyltransferase